MAGRADATGSDDRVTRLQRVVAALADASTVDDVATAAVETGLAEAGSVSGGIWLPDGDDLVTVHGVWAGEDIRNRFARVPIDARLPAAEAYRTGAGVWVGGPPASDARFPELAATTAGPYFALPLRGTKAVLGVFAGTLPAEPSEPDRTFIATIADLCAQALERTRAYEQERQARQTLEFLADATAAMVGAHEPEQVLQQLVRLAVPRLASWCAVYAAEPEGLRRVIVEATFDRAMDVAPTALLPLDVDTAVTRAFRTGVPEVITIDRAFLSTYFPEPVVDAFLGHGLTASLAVPIRLGDEGLGVLGLALERDSDEFRFAAVGLAARAAIALENARRHRHQEDLVRSLTEALLPSGLPVVDGYELAARYVPSSGGVCGDWYEAEPMPDGTLWFALGDASGHGISAASTMALVRNAAIGLREAERDPARVLAMLSRVVEHARPSDIVTAVHGTIEPASGDVRWCSAGHPHGVIRSRHGAVRELAGVHGPPLGVRADYETNRYRLHAGDTLILFTDGVVERRGEDVSVGVERLFDVIAGAPDAGATTLGDWIVEHLCAEPDDDCCVLVISRVSGA